MKELCHILSDRKAASFLVILGIAGLLYLNSLDNRFQYDDRHSIVENPHIRSLGNIPAFFVKPELFSRDPEKAMYRPLVLVSLALNYAWSGYETYSYHLVNIALHSLCALLVWGILLGVGRPPCMAFLGGLLFAAHPLCSEPVNYISSRSELLAAVGVLGSFWLYLSAERSPGSVLPPGAGSFRRYIAGEGHSERKAMAGSLLFFAVGLLSKSTAITLPALLVCAAFSRGCLDRRTAIRYLPYAVIALGYLVAVRGFLTKAVLAEPVRSMGEQLGTQAKALVYYLKLFFLPVGLNVHHAFSESPLFDWPVLLCLLVLFPLFLFAWRGRETHPCIFLGLCWMGITLTPTLLVPLNVLVNEHRLYLPLVGLIILLTGLRGLQEIPGLRWGVLLLLVGMGLLTWQRNQVWADEFTLWSDAGRKAPQEVRPYVYMGNYAREMGKPERALRYYERALQLEPENAAVRGNMGNAFRDLGHFEEAIATFRGILEDHPELGDMRYSLARIYQEKEDFEQARKQYLLVPAESFHYDLVLNNLGAMHEMEGQVDSALFYYHRALERKSESPNARINLERLQQKLIRQVEGLFDEGDFTKADYLCRLILEKDDRHLYARFFLAVSLFQQARYSESIGENQKLMQIYPDFDDGRLQLANVLEAGGRSSEARQAYEELLQRSRDGDMRRIAEQRLRRLLERTR